MISMRHPLDEICYMSNLKFLIELICSIFLFSDMIDTDACIEIYICFNYLIYNITIFIY